LGTSGNLFVSRKEKRGNDDVIRTLTQVLKSVASGRVESNLSKIDLQGFKGTDSEDASEFLSKFMRIARLKGWSSNDCCMYFLFYLSGRAVKWFDRLTLEVRNNFAKLKDSFRTQFTPTCLNQIREAEMDLMNLYVPLLIDSQKYSAATRKL